MKRRYWLGLAVVVTTVVVTLAGVAWVRAAREGHGKLFGFIFERVKQAHAALDTADIVVNVVEVPPDQVTISGWARHGNRSVSSLEDLPALVPQLASPTVAIVVSGPGDILGPLAPQVETALNDVRRIMARRGAVLPPLGYTLRIRRDTGGRATTRSG